MTRVMMIAAALVAMMLTTTQVQAQTPKTGMISGYSESETGAIISVNPTVKWNATYGAWKVDYSVNINLNGTNGARNTLLVGHSNAAIAEYDANVAKYKRAGGPWYQMRYANTYRSDWKCSLENPAAYNSELVGGTGWYRSFWAAPGEKTCLSVWIYGDNPYSPKGSTYNPPNFGSLFQPIGSVYFVAPPAPAP